MTNDRKRCSICKQYKPIGDFYSQRKGAYGVGSRCKSCLFQYNRSRRLQIRNSKDGN